MYTQFFGNYLLANGYVTRDQLFLAMHREADQHMKLGTLAIHAGYMSAAQVDDVVIHQTHQDSKFGELAVQLGYLTEEQVMELLLQQTPAFLALGQVLLDDGVLTNADFEQILNDYRAKNGMGHEESVIEQQETIRQLFRNFFSVSNTDISQNGHTYIELLFNNFVRFIGSDFTPIAVSEVTEASVSCCVKQEIHGAYAINTYISMDQPTAIAFASSYVHEQFYEYDEYVEASLEDFVNLQNGLFIVNISNNSRLELTLGAPEQILEPKLPFAGKTLRFSILYAFGSIDFYMEQVHIDA